MRPLPCHAAGPLTSCSKQPWMLSSGATRLTVIGLEQRTVDGDDEKRAITPCGASLAKRSHLAPKGARKRGGRASVSLFAQPRDPPADRHKSTRDGQDARRTDSNQHHARPPPPAARRPRQQPRPTCRRSTSLSHGCKVIRSFNKRSSSLDITPRAVAVAVTERHTARRTGAGCI